ncbi:hypothetical protein CYMTET_49641 [Cymbomonas tetramitiformis]|uniref:ABC1 atypical kinase-like domain-containing protein n=1 Tax=Cymbomonas tetramitiformis TaxID=36881 RepID=A0AAE0BRR1_9CHLO|nr:hypothetical protein CYMTET_49641 [Cymbomonas tetramitiformis]
MMETPVGPLKRNRPFPRAAKGGSEWWETARSLSGAGTGALRDIMLKVTCSCLIGGCVSQALVWLEDSGLNGSEDLPNIVDEVGAGIFRELDYTQEATNMADFSEALSFLDYLKVARTYDHLTTRRVMTQEWLRGRPMKELNLEEQKKMVKMGVECSSAQLFRTGLVHADPHEGNMMYTDDGKLAILDFGLICRVDNSQQEAMAGCILNILNGDWNELIDNLRVMEMLPTTAQRWIGEDGKQADYTSDKGTWQEIDDAEFRRAFAECMDGPDPNNKVVRANFTELVVDLTALSTGYRFQLPPYMVFIIRSLTTLDFCAVRTNCNMYEVAAPTALFRALSPRSATGRDALARALLSDSGDLQWERLQQLATSAMGDKTDSKVSADGLVEAAESMGTTDSLPSTSGEDAGAEMQKMMTDLVKTKDGVALRRILADANPGTILPPKALRVVMAEVAREHFARETRNFSARLFLASVRNAVMSGIKADKEEELCDVSEEGRLKCMESLNNRRKQVAWKIIMRKLSAPGGLWASIRLLGILVWAAMAGSMYGLGQRIVSKLKGGRSKEARVDQVVTA